MLISVFSCPLATSKPVETPGRKKNPALKKYLFGLVVFLSFAEPLHAQDPAFSQFYAYKLYLNPAMSGSEPGLNMAAIYRNQWNEIYKSLATYGFAADIRSDRLSSGFGMLVLQDRASDIYSTTYLGGTYSFILRLTKSWNVNIGLNAAYVSKQVDAGRLIFADQIDPVGGITGESAVSVIREKVQYFDMGAGVLTQFRFDVGKYEAHNSLGFAAQHITRPDESFQNLDARLPIRYTVHGGSMIPLDMSKKKSGAAFFISPAFRFDYQAKTKLFTVGFYNIFNPVYFGLFYQDNHFSGGGNTKALIINGGVKVPMSEYSNMIVGYSYDLDISGVTTRSKGVHEISLRINLEDITIFDKKPGKKGFPVPCYEFDNKNSIRLF